MSAQEKARQLISSLAGIPVSQIPHDASVGSFSGWDSIVHMELIVMVEASLERELSEGEMLSISSIAGLSNVLETGDLPPK